MRTNFSVLSAFIYIHSIRFHYMRDISSHLEWFLLFFRKNAHWLTSKSIKKCDRAICTEKHTGAWSIWMLTHSSKIVFSEISSKWNSPKFQFNSKFHFFLQHNTAWNVWWESIVDENQLLSLNLCAKSAHILLYFSIIVNSSHRCCYLWTGRKEMYCMHGIIA